MKLAITNISFNYSIINLKKNIKLFFNIITKLIIIYIFIIMIINLTFYHKKVYGILKFKKYYKYYKKYYKIRYNKLINNFYNSIKSKKKVKIKRNSFKLNVALCVIAKQENLYINEFVDYYKNLGIKKIFIYDNNELEDEKFDKILNKEIIEGFVKIIDFRGLISPQIRAYEDCYENNKNQFDWIAFYDVDEFLYLKCHKNINTFLSLPYFKECSSILINWRIYGDNNKIYYESKPLQKRFTTKFIFSKKKKKKIYFYAAAKSIVRGGLNISWSHFPHYLKNLNICRPDGSKVIKPLSPPQYYSAYIKHFTTKSTEEYIIKLFKGDVNIRNYLNYKHFFKRIKNYYFFFNEVTKRKVKFINQILKFDIRKYLK